MFLNLDLYAHPNLSQQSSALVLEYQSPIKLNIPNERFWKPSWCQHWEHEQLFHVNNPFLRSRSNSNFPLAEEREFISGNGTLSTLCRSERSLWGSGKLAPWAIRKGDYNISLFKNVPGIEICKTPRNGRSEGNSWEVLCERACFN